MHGQRNIKIGKLMFAVSPLSSHVPLYFLYNDMYV